MQGKFLAISFYNVVMVNCVEVISDIKLYKGRDSMLLAEGTLSKNFAALPVPLISILSTLQLLVLEP